MWRCIHQTAVKQAEHKWAEMRVNPHLISHTPATEDSRDTDKSSNKGLCVDLNLFFSSNYILNNLSLCF